MPAPGTPRLLSIPSCRLSHLTCLLAYCLPALPVALHVRAVRVTHSYGCARLWSRLLMQGHQVYAGCLGIWATKQLQQAEMVGSSE